MPQCSKHLALVTSALCRSESGASLTEGAGKMDPVILWELFQCQTPVLSVFSDAESWSVFVTQGEMVPRIETNWFDLALVHWIKVFVIES